MAAIENERDLILQATVPRVLPVLIPIDKIEGLPEALKSLRIKSTATTFIGTSGATNPATITLTAEKLGGLTGSVTWSVITGNGTITPNGDTCVVTGSSVTGYSITIRARVTVAGTNYDAQMTLTKLGRLSEQERVNLTTQVTGQLASGNVNGLGALALLNTVDLNTQTTGALNGQTQVTNLGSLAYANAIAANQIGAGQLAAGVIYAGSINATQVTSGSFSGKTFAGGTFTGGVFQTSASGGRVVIRASDNTLRFYQADGTEVISLNPDNGRMNINTTQSVRGAIDIGGSGIGITADVTRTAGSFIVRGNVAEAGLYGASYSSSTSAKGVEAFSTYGTGLYATSDYGVAATLRSTYGNSPPLRLYPLSTLPADKTAGGMCYHTTHGLCIATGSDWRTASGWTVVT